MSLIILTRKLNPLQKTFLRTLHSDGQKRYETRSKPRDLNERFGAPVDPQDKRFVDVFGTLSRTGAMKLDRERIHKTDNKYAKFEHDITKRKNLYYYKYEISKQSKLGKVGLVKALELFKEMKVEAGLEPIVQNFSPLMNSCAKHGYTQRAFELYKEYTDKGKKPTCSMVTSLLSSCGECPFREYGKERLDWFLNQVSADHGVKLNKIQYNAAIKSYGKLGHLDKASEMVDAMISSGINPDVETFNMLLIGCVANRDAGLTLALKVFKRMKQYEIKPTTETYNLLLRCIRDCGVGSHQLLKDAIAEFPAMATLNEKLKYKAIRPDKRKKKLSLREKNEATTAWIPLMSDLGKSLNRDLQPERLETSNGVKLLTSGGHNDQANIEGYIVIGRDITVPQGQIAIAKTGVMPNILSDDHINLFLQIEGLDMTKMVNREQRFKLFGSMHGFLEKMTTDGCKPCTKTFGLILGCISNKKGEIMEFYRLFDDYSVELDLAKFNMIINRVCFSGHPKRLELAGFFLNEMMQKGLRPDIETFEALAYGCDSWKSAQKLLNDMRECGLMSSDRMIDNFFRDASHKYMFSYLNGLIDYCLKNKNYQPKKEVLEALDKTLVSAYDVILKYEKGNLDEKPSWLKDETDIKYYDYVRKKLPIWLKMSKLRETDHPWKQYEV